MHTFVGTSGYSYKEWKGSFYPSDIAPADMLSYYGRWFNSVEINNTFYRMPTGAVAAQWAAQVPAGFSFVLKASRRITHLKRLNDVSGELDYFLGVATDLKQKLGPVLFQLPPNFKKDLGRLESFVKLLPRRRRAAVEFRHPSWFDDEVRAMLGASNIALVVSDSAEATPSVTPTADWGYIRLRRDAYQDDDLLSWAHRLRETEWRDVFVFFKHEDAGTGPRLAKRFIDMLRG